MSGPTTAGSIVGKLKLDKSEWDRQRAEAKVEAAELGRLSPTIHVDVNAGEAVAQLEAVRGAEAGLGNQGGITAGRTALIAGAIATLIPMLAPLAGYAVGVAGALAGMGAAGVLAVLGIVHAMADGTAAGNTFSAGITKAKGYLQQLEQTASNGVLKGFTSSLALVGAAMPQLNQQIAVFAKQLGATATFLTQGVITALHVLNPLFLQAGQYVEQLALGFSSWTSNGGLQQFTSMAIAAFPQVAAALGALLKGVLDVVAALAPLGTVMLGVITVVGGLLSAISPLLGVLVPVAAVAGAVYGAFMLWTSIAPVIKTVASSIASIGVATWEALGPVGLIAGAVAAAVVAFAGWNAALSLGKALAQASALATQDYTAAIVADNGAIKQATTAQLAKNLHDSGAIENAHKLGISTQDLTAAIMGNKDAMTRVDAATQAHTNGSKAQEEQLKKTGLSLSDLGTTQQWVRDAVAHGTQGIKEGTDAYKGLEAAQAAAAAKGQENISITDRLAAAQDAAKAATDKLAQALAGLGNENLSATQANVAYQQALADSSAAALKNGQTLDANTQAGRDNTTALDGVASSAVSLISAQAKAGTSAADLTANMGAARASFIATAEKMGATADQANHLADQYGLIPNNVTTAVHATGVDTAVAQVANLKSWLDQLQSKTVVVTVQTNSVGAPSGYGMANSSVPRMYADGGTVSGPGGPKTDSVAAYLSVGEEVTPNPQAGRYRPVLKALARDDRDGASQALGNAKPVQHNQYSTTNNYYTINETINPQATAQMVTHYQAIQGV